jgi:hypothetical protein
MYMMRTRVAWITHKEVDKEEPDLRKLANVNKKNEPPKYSSNAELIYLYGFCEIILASKLSKDFRKYNNE